MMISQKFNPDFKVHKYPRKMKKAISRFGPFVNPSFDVRFRFTGRKTKYKTKTFHFVKRCVRDCKAIEYGFGPFFALEQLSFGSRCITLRFIGDNKTKP